VQVVQYGELLALVLIEARRQIRAVAHVACENCGVEYGALSTALGVGSGGGYTNYGCRKEAEGKEWYGL